MERDLSKVGRSNGGRLLVDLELPDHRDWTWTRSDDRSSQRQ